MHTSRSQAAERGKTEHRADRSWAGGGKLGRKTQLLETIQLHLEKLKLQRTKEAQSFRNSELYIHIILRKMYIQKIAKHFSYHLEKSHMLPAGETCVSARWMRLTYWSTDTLPQRRSLFTCFKVLLSFSLFFLIFWKIIPFFFHNFPRVS